MAVGGLPVAKPNLREIRRRVGIVFQDPDDQLFMPTVGEDVAFGPANFGVTGTALRRAGGRRARTPSAWPSTATARRCTCPAGSAGGWRWPPCWPASPEILVLDEPSSNLDPVARRELAEVLLGLRPRRC